MFVFVIKYILSLDQNLRESRWSFSTVASNSSKKRSISPAENKFVLEFSSKIFFFTELGSVDIAFEECK